MLLNDLMNPGTLQSYIDSLFVEGDERLEDGNIRCGIGEIEDRVAIRQI